MPLITGEFFLTARRLSLSSEAIVLYLYLACERERVGEPLPYAVTDCALVRAYCRVGQKAARRALRELESAGVIAVHSEPSRKWIEFRGAAA